LRCGPEPVLEDTGGDDGGAPLLHSGTAVAPGCRGPHEPEPRGDGAGLGGATAPGLGTHFPAVHNEGPPLLTLPVAPSACFVEAGCIDVSPIGVDCICLGRDKFCIGVGTRCGIAALTLGGPEGDVTPDFGRARLGIAVGSGCGIEPAEPALFAEVPGFGIRATSGRLVGGGA
jgi:hypothetical protein